ncbi:Alpha/Beta hydrolase protein [Dipodascopsis uninucleata]
MSSSNLSKLPTKSILTAAVAIGVVGAAAYAGEIFYSYYQNKKNPPRSNPKSLNYPDIALSEKSCVSPSSGRTISWAEYGNPESKNVFIYEHGLPGSRILPVGPKLKGKDIRVLAMDRPGMGYTSLPLPGKTVMETAISDVFELLDYLQITDPVSLVGFSAGGPHVLGILITRPEMVKTVYCLGPASYLDEKINWDDLSPGARKENALANKSPCYYAFKMVQNADKIVDCSNVIENMKNFSSKGDAVFLAENPVEANGWHMVNYEAYRQGVTGYVQSCVEIFGRTSAKPWPVVGDIIHQKGIEGKKVFVIHRESDHLTPPSGSKDLVRRLKAAGADAEFVFIEGEEGGHFMTLNDGFQFIFKDLGIEW